MDMVVSRTKVWLDARFAKVRRKETNGSNFLAELMARATGADVALLNAGSIRADRFLEKGEMTMRDLCDLLVRVLLVTLQGLHFGTPCHCLFIILVLVLSTNNHILMLSRAGCFYESQWQVSVIALIILWWYVKYIVSRSFCNFLPPANKLSYSFLNLFHSYSCNQTKQL